MKGTVVLTEAAERDIDAAAVWYGRETGRADQFLDAVATALERIENNPKQFPVAYRDKRRALLKRFPYGLYFRIEATSVVVVGCFHGHRNPEAWQSRR